MCESEMQEAPEELEVLEGDGDPPSEVSTLAIVLESAPNDWRSDTMALICVLVRPAACTGRALPPRRRIVANVAPPIKRVIFDMGM